MLTIYSRYPLNSAGIVILLYCFLAYAGSDSIAQSATQEADPINIEITTHLGDQQSYGEGDTLEFLINLSQNAYILLLYENAAHQIIQVLPNQLSPKAYLTAGIYQKVPPDNASYTFTIAAPFGRETLWAFAAEQPFPDIEGELLATGLKVLKPDFAELNAKIMRSFKKQNLKVSKTSLTIHTYKVNDF